MKLIDIETTQPITVADENGILRNGFLFIDGKTQRVEAIPIGYIDQVIDEYEHMIEHYLYDDDEDLKEYLCYRNCLNNLKRRWKRDRQKLRL